MNVYIYACVHTCARTHIYTHSFSDSFHSRLLHIKYSSLCYMVGLCCLPILYIVSITLCLVAQLYLTLCNTKDCVFEELGRLLYPWGFSRQEYWSAFPCPPPGDLPNPEMELRSPALQADSLMSESPGKPLYSIVYLLIPNSLIYPSWLSPLANHKFVFYICQYISVLEMSSFVLFCFRFYI